ncbi:hypothetical protein ATC03_18010 [Agromyces aureus]|uniref:DUF5979 domain-containing protein n=1 Tax=Agromyces aureus TaxID=453304 RepID=A0A191WJC4_9MICO|nr:hypothetical protein ATC03_18010 [Agromyces aureus]
MVLGIGAAVPASALPEPAPVDITAVATLEKSTSETEVVPGEPFTYTLTMGCSSITDAGCRGAVLSDTVPAPFQLVGATVGSGANTAADPVISGNSVTVNWTTPLGDGTTGILDATTAIVDITAVLPAGTSYDLSGIPVLNSALIEGVNFADVPAEVAVTPVIPLALATTPTKTIDPASAIATPGTAVGASLEATNDSNATVDSLAVEDPVDPAASPNPFEYLGFSGFGAVTPPEGATSTSYEVYVAGAWVAAPDGVLPAGVDDADVRGTRVTFAGEIPAGASASVDLDLAVTELAATQPDGFIVTNTVLSEVALGDESATGESSDDFTLLQNDVQVGATKSFDPDLVIAGESSTVTLGAVNDSTVPLDSLTIREPSAGWFPDLYTFDGFTSGVDFPAGAISGTVVYHLADGTTEEVPLTDGETPQAPTAGDAEVDSFEIVFEGTIAPGSETSVSFDVATDPDATGLPQTVNNEVAVVGENDGVTGEAVADDDLYVYDETIEPYIRKTIRPSQIVAAPGENVTISLEGGLTERPNPPETPTGTTGYADQIVLQDPLDPVEPNAWWNAFDLTAITQTPVPGDSTLTVEYYDTTDDTWKTLEGPIAGPTIFSAPVDPAISAVAGGIRFVYDYTGTGDGFAPGTDLAPNFTSEVRANGRYEPGPPFDDEESTFIPNCAQSDAMSATPGVPSGSAAMPTAECPEVELIPVDPGTADLIDKAFGTSSSGGVKSVIARSGDTIPSTQYWSTGGFSNLERVELTDVADPEGTAIADSVYDAFNLTRVQPITTANDPLIAFDEVTAVLLWDGSAWTPAANDPCPDSCIGQFPGVTLTGAEQQSTLGVQLVFAESRDRAEASEGDLDAPPVGSGVARSFGNDRQVQLVWQVRDEKRSDGAPVLGDELYNLTDPGVVHNTVNVTGHLADGGTPLSSNDQDDVVIVDVPITTTTDKNWQGGPLSVPEIGIPASQYPLSRITVTTRNTTPARVDQLQITDTAPGSVVDRRSDPFQAFTFNNFATITVPSGTLQTVVRLFCPDGSQSEYTRAEALALTPAALTCDVSGVQVEFDGRIVANGAGVVAFDVRLRPVWRGTTDPVSVADTPTTNTAEGIVADIDAIGTCPPADDARYACDQASAIIALEEPSFGVTAGKAISPAQQKVDDFSPVTVTVSGQPNGSTRPRTMTISDDDPTFWNAVDFLGMDAAWALPAPVERVTACYLSGGDFSAANIVADTVGGAWSCGPNGGTIDEARTFLAAAPAADVHGLRFMFAAGSGLGWTNPANPLVNVPFQVERRVDLRSGDPVPTTRADQVPAPGEEAAGVFWNTVDVDAVSADIAVGQSLSASDSADAEYRNLHLEAAVTVTKSPTGDIRPGAVIPFVLTFANVGEAPFTDPVFTDELPTDTNGRQLIFDPDRDPSVSPYAFALTGAAPAPPNGTPLPTDSDLVVVEEVGDTIVFTMPDGSVLEPGQTYTITIQLMLRPGLTPNDDVENWAVVEASEPFDDCVPVLRPDGSCADSTVVSPLAVPALSTVKYVKADVQHGEAGIPEVIGSSGAFLCEPTTVDPEGFFRAPCIPVTLPGGTETWKFNVTNSGTLPMDRVVSIDNLPIPGDQGLIAQLPRGSEWQPGFTGLVELVDPPSGASLTTFYSTSSVPCTADLNPVGTPCAAGTWLPLDDSVDPAIVRSLKFQIDFAGDFFQPGEVLQLRLQTRTSPDQAVQDTYPIAWNTVATGGSALAGDATIVVPATEGRRVGVSYPTGPIRLAKTVTGPGAAFAPDEFAVQLTCASDGVDLVELPELTLVPGADPAQVEGLPWGSTCTATEAGQGQSSQIIGSALVGGPLEVVEVISVENVFEIGGLVITKRVETAAVDEQGDPIPYPGPFEISVTCEFLGSPVFADGYDAQSPMVAELADGGTWSLVGLPDGASCSIEETDDAGAVSAVVSPEVVVIDAEASATVDVENTFAAGSIAIEKVVDGSGAADFGAGPFTLHLTCVLDDASGERTVYDADIVLGGDLPLTTQIDDLAAGATCDVTETDDAGAQSATVDPESITVGADQVAQVTVTNTFVAGSLTVTKEIVGDGAELYGSGPFEVTLVCTREGVDGPVEVAVPGGAARGLTEENAYTATYASLLVGSECALEETTTGGATSVAFLDAEGEPVESVTIAEGEVGTQVRLVNTFLTGGIVVEKTITGSGAAAATGPFTVRLECTSDIDGVATPVVVPGGADRTLSRAGGLTAAYDDLPAGADCTLTETDDGGAARTTITPNAGDPLVGAVEVVAGGSVRLEVENSFDPLAVTGFDAAPALAAALAAFALGAAALAVALVRRRRIVAVHVRRTPRH